MSNHARFVPSNDIKNQKEKKKKKWQHEKH